MKKTKLAIGLMTAMLTAGSLAGCDNTVKYSADGKIITYTEKESGKTTTITADVDAEDGSLVSLLADYYKDSSKFQSIFDAIYNIVVRNYFNLEDNYDTGKKNPDGTPIIIPLGKGQMPQIELDAKKSVESDKDKANRNASNNGTSYSEEFDKILSEKGAKDEDELREKYIEENKKKTFDENFYKYHVKEIKNGDPDVKYGKTSEEPDGKQLWNGYFKDMLPYHVSHILVKVEDGSSTNYSNGTISEDNANKLFNLVDALRKGENSFGTLAKRFSDDEGSGANYGNLGIMDYSTSYVNEFKLGIYAYENFLAGADRKALVVDSNINIPGNKKTGNPDAGTVAGNLIEETTKSYDGKVIPEIDYSVFDELNKAAKIDKDINNKSVIGDSANFFPRNIIYNKYLNRHSFAFITYDQIDKDENTKKYLHGVDATTGFVMNSELKNPIPDFDQHKGILAVKTANGWTPILCARAGTSDYQGIHFIVVERSYFVEGEDDNKVTRDEYYTTYYPEQDNYPVDDKGNAKATYVNFSVRETTETQKVAEGLMSTMKSYDSERLNKYIFQKFFDQEGLKIKNSELENILNMWISRGFEKKEQEKNEAWEKTWNDYIDTLRKQNSERGKLVSNACRIGYLYGNGLDKDRKPVDLDTYEIDGVKLIDLMVAAMQEAHEEIVINFETQEKCDAHDATSDQVKAYIKSIRIGNSAIEDGINSITELFKKEGALCNDGQEHI